MAAAHQQFSLKWNNYSQHIVSALEELRVDDELTDVTLSCDGKRIKAHKVLLSACSVFFKDTFKENPCKHPVVILKGVTFQDLQSVVQFMYNGQVNVTQERLPSFLQTAETLQIKGLTDSNNDKEESSSTAPVKKRPQTFPSQVTTVADSVRQDAESRPPTPKRKRVIGSTGGTFPASAQNSELPGTASVISASGAVVAGASGNNSHHSNNSQPPSLITRNNSENSVDGLPIVKYEEEQDMEDDYDRGEDNDNSYQDNNEKDVLGGESTSLGSINTSIRTCTSSTSGPGERRPRYNMQPSSIDTVAAAGVVDATNVNGRQNGHFSRADPIYSNPVSSFAHTNGTVVMTNGTMNASKLRHRLSSRSLSSGGSGYHHPQQQQQQQQLQQQDHDRVIKYAPMQSAPNSSSSHDSRSNSSHEDAGERHFNDEGSESFQGTDEDDELHHYQFQQQQQRRGSVSNGSSFAAQAYHHKNRLSMPSLIKSNNNASQFSQQQQPINYRSNNTAVINGTTTTNARSGITKAEVCAVSPEDLSASSPKAAAGVNEISTPSFSLTQQLLQQNVLSLISSNGPTDGGIKRENGSGSFARVSAISVQSSQASSSNGGGASITLVDQPAVVAPYVCDICGKRYVHHRSLNDHKKSHTGATRCPVCNKSFSKVANMRAHYQAQHGSLSENGGGGDSSNNSSDMHPISQEQQQQQNGRVPIKQMV